MMSVDKTTLQERIERGQTILLAEATLPKSADPRSIREFFQGAQGKFHAVGIPDNRDGARLSALAAATIALSEGMEPLLHVVTRDRNRIALLSECLGAQALGIKNILCTSGVHQTLGRAREAKAVYDLDSIQLLQAFNHLETDGSCVGEPGFEKASGLCLAGTATPEADPMALQITKTEKKIQAGARILITQPVFDLERFKTWWQAITARGIHEKVAIVAGLEPLLSSGEAKTHSESRPSPRIPDALLDRLASKNGEGAQRAEGIAIAAEILERLSAIKGLRGFQLRGDLEATLTLVNRLGLKAG